MHYIRYCRLRELISVSVIEVCHEIYPNDNRTCEFDDIWYLEFPEFFGQK